MSISRLAAGLALVIAAAGLVFQAGFVLDEMRSQLDRRGQQPLRSFLVRADQIIPEGERYATTSPLRADDARYHLYPRRRAEVALNEQALRDAGVRWVVVTNDQVPEQLRGVQPWFAVRLRSSQGRLLEVLPQ